MFLQIRIFEAALRRVARGVLQVKIFEEAIRRVVRDSCS